MNSPVIFEGTEKSEDAQLIMNEKSFAVLKRPVMDAAGRGRRGVSCPRPKVNDYLVSVA